MANEKVTVIVPKEGAFQKRIVRCCNMYYIDEDEFILHEDLLDWLNINVVGDCAIKQDYTTIIFKFDTEADAVLFRLVYL
ncbi:MAG: hypothetical protein HC836_25735 [Richelia sp. RM2_1_2]|nr:hypothetical protein [Richelia sp. RM2_1_2]